MNVKIFSQEKRPRLCQFDSRMFFFCQFQAPPLLSIQSAKCSLQPAKTFCNNNYLLFALTDRRENPFKSSVWVKCSLQISCPFQGILSIKSLIATGVNYCSLYFAFNKSIYFCHSSIFIDTIPPQLSFHIKRKRMKTTKWRTFVIFYHQEVMTFSKSSTVKQDVEHKISNPHQDNTILYINSSEGI